MIALKRKKLINCFCLALVSGFGWSSWGYFGATELTAPILDSYHASQSGENLTAVNGTIFEHEEEGRPQKILGSFGVLLANVGSTDETELRSNFANGVYYDGAVIENSVGSQIVGTKDDKISSIAINSTHPYNSMSYYNNRGIAIANYRLGDIEGRQEIFSRIGSIGSPEQNFTIGVVERGYGLQYIESIGVLYANPIGILSGIDDLAGRGNRANDFFDGQQIIKSIGSVIVDSRQQQAEKVGDPGNFGLEIRKSWPVFGILNWNQTRKDRGVNQYIGIENLIQATTDYPQQTSLGEDGFSRQTIGVANRGGFQIIEALREEGARIKVGSKTKEGTYEGGASVHVSPLKPDYEDASDAVTVLRGKFTVESGSLYAAGTNTNLAALKLENSSSHSGEITLNPGVSIFIGRTLTRDGSPRNSLLSVGTKDNPYRIRFGAHSGLYNQGRFQGNALFVFSREGNNVTSGGVFLRQVDKQEDGSLSRINLAVKGENPDKLSFHDAEKVLRSAAHRVFVDKGVENLEESRINGEIKHGTVTINEGLINKYKASYALKPVNSVGNPDGVKEIGFDNGLNAENSASRYQYEGEIVGSIEGGEPRGRDEPQIINDKTSTMTSIDEVGLSQYFIWRQDNETLYQRLGEIRNDEISEGPWVRVIGGRNKYNRNSVYYRNDFGGIQLGVDRTAARTENGKWLLGAGFTVLRGNADLSNKGSGKNNLASLSGYGTFLWNNDMYVDLIFKLSRLHDKFTAVSDNYEYISKGRFNNYAIQIGAEAGKRLSFGTEQNWFIEPQVQVLYGRIKGNNFDTDTGVGVSTKAIDSVIGRIGLSGGYKGNLGSAFIKVDGLREFSARYRAGYHMIGGVAHNRSTVDLKDSWLDVGIGGTMRLSKNTSGFAQVKRSFGGNFNQVFRADIGLRYEF